MALSDQDRVLEKSTTTGTGTYTLAGTPGITGFNTNDYQLFSVVGNGNTCRYLAVGVDPATGIPNNTGWEFGLGTYTASGTTLARTAIYSSSNSGSAVSWVAGTRFVWVTSGSKGTVVVRKPAGTVGTDELQLSVGSNSLGNIKSLGGDLLLTCEDSHMVQFGRSSDGVVAATLNCGGAPTLLSLLYSGQILLYATAGGDRRLWMVPGTIYMPSDFAILAGASTDASTSIDIGLIRSGVSTFSLVKDGSRTLGGRLQVGIGSTATVGAVPCIIFDHFADVGNVGTGEDDLYTDTLGASTFGANGDKVIAEYDLVLASSATATRQLKIYVAGTLVGASGALTVTSGGTIQAFVSVIRVSSSVLRVTTEIVPSGLTIQPVVTYTEITGLTLSNSQIIKITGEAAGTGAATNDLIAKMGYGWYLPNA